MESTWHIVGTQQTLSFTISEAVQLNSANSPQKGLPLSALSHRNLLRPHRHLPPSRLPPRSCLSPAAPTFHGLGSEVWAQQRHCQQQTEYQLHQHLLIRSPQVCRAQGRPGLEGLKWGKRDRCGRDEHVTPHPTNIPRTSHEGARTRTAWKGRREQH